MLKQQKTEKILNHPVRGFAARLQGFFFSLRLEIGLLSVIPAAFLVKPNGMFCSYPNLGIIASMVLLFAGMILRTWAGGSAGSHTGDSKIQAGHLTTSGPYAYVRNPIYLGTILVGIGMVGLIGDSHLFPLCALTFVVLYAVIVPAEEKFLRKSFEAEYEAYFQAVPRWIPRSVCWKESRTESFNWGILAGEAPIMAVLLLIYGVLKFAAYLK